MTVAFDVDDNAIGAVLSRLTALGVTGMTVTPPSLEELFMRHYGGSVAAETSSREASAVR